MVNDKGKFWLDAALPLVHHPHQLGIKPQNPFSENGATEVKWHNTESAVVIEQTDDRAIQLRGVIVCSTQRMTKTLNNFTSETQFSLSLKLITFGEREVTVSCQDYWG